MDKKLREIPEKPGCYLYFDKKGKIIYIGKAKNLKKRVFSYFTKKNLDKKTEVLVSNIEKIDFIVTNTETEAFLLENNLIKKYSPKYNIELKDSKSYSFVKLTNDSFPRLVVSRNSRNDDNQKKNLFGPFISSKNRDQVINLLNKTFKLRTCKKLPKKKCIRFDLGLCSAPCINKISKDQYNQDVSKATLALLGKNKELISLLNKTMKEFSKNKEYEKALIAKEQIEAINYLNEKQSVQRSKKYDEDIINYIIKKDKVHLMVFNINKGLLENKKSYIFSFREGFFEEFLKRYYSKEKIPNKIIVPTKVDNSLEDYFSYLKNSRVIIKKPEKGELFHLLELVKKNIELSNFQKTNKLLELKNLLNLKKIPETIECFDISHLGGTQTVASMVQFKDASPKKSNYRKFKIRSVQGNDDFKSMQEVIFRRYSKLKKENNILPDLIIVDGGKGQLSSALKSLNKLNLKIPIIALAKKFEEIFIPGKKKSIVLKENNVARLLLEQIRNEAHRFAITYQRKLREKRYFS